MISRPTAATGAFPYPHPTVAEVEARRRTRASAMPLPADFTTYAPGKSVNHLQKHYGASERAVKRWQAETGVRLYDPATDPAITRPVKPMPQGFASRAPHHSDRELGRQYGCDYNEWYRESSAPSAETPMRANAEESNRAMVLALKRYAIRHHPDAAWLRASA